MQLLVSGPEIKSLGVDNRSEVLVAIAKTISRREALKISLEALGAVSAPAHYENPAVWI